MSDGAAIAADWRMRIARLWRTAVGIAMLVLLMLVAAQAATDITYENAPGLTVPLIVLFWIVCAVVHEFGHAAVARLLGWDVHYVMLAGILYSPARRRFSRMHRSAGTRFAGFVFATPHPDRWSAAGDAWFTAGGPLANFLLAALCLGLASRLTPHGMAAALTEGLAMSSLVIGAINLVPTYGSGRSDGAGLVAFAAGRTRSDQERVFQRIGGLLADGVPLTQWDPALIAAVESDAGMDSGQRLTILVSICLAEGDLRRLLAVLRDAETADPHAVDRHNANYAFAAAIVERDAGRASAILARCPDPQSQSFEYWRAMAVIAVLKDMPAEAKNAMVMGRQAARAAGTRPDADDEVLFAALTDGVPPPEAFARA